LELEGVAGAAPFSFATAGDYMPSEPRDGLFLKIGPLQAAAYGRLAVVVLGMLVVIYLAGHGLAWW
jgi:hypothetical protein